MKAKTSMAASDGADVAQRLLRRPALAEEAVQDAFVQVWRRAASFDPARGGARTWLYAVLRHRALNILRGEVRTDLVDDFEPMGLASEEENAESRCPAVRSRRAAPLP